MPDLRLEQRVLLTHPHESVRRRFRLLVRDSRLLREGQRSASSVSCRTQLTHKVCTDTAYFRLGQSKVRRSLRVRESEIVSDSVRDG